MLLLLKGFSRGKFGLWLFCTVYLVFNANISFAVLAENLTIGNAKALSLGNAVTADPPGIDSIHFNPAGLADLDGRQYHLKFIAGAFDFIMDLGDYSETRKRAVQTVKDRTDYPDEFWNDIAYQSVSETSGVSVMLPGLGLTDMSALVGVMGGASYSPPGSKITFGTNVYAPLMVGFFREDDDPGRWIGRRFSVTLLTYFSPSFAYKVNDDFTIGASMNFNYAGVGIELPFHAPSLLVLYLADIQDNFCGPYPDLPICASTLPLYANWGTISFEVEDPLTIGFNAGFLWDITEWLTLGVAYQSPVKMEMEGEYTWPYNENFVGFTQGLVNGFNGTLGPTLNTLFSSLGYQFPEGQSGISGVGSLNMENPQHVSVGISLQMSPKLKVNVDYKFTEWSVWEYLTLELDQPSDLMRFAQILQPELATASSASFPLMLQDTWNFALGVEYQFSESLVLRCGVEDRPTSVTEGNVSPLFPIGSDRLYGMGFGYTTDDGGQFDFSLGYFASKVDIPPNSSHVGNNEDALEIVYNPYPGQYIETELTSYMLEMSYSQHF